MTTSHTAIAERLRNAYVAGPVAPLRDGLEARDIQGAYAVQSLNTRFWMEQGRRVVGRKIGLTAKTVQAQLGVDEPDGATLSVDRVFIPRQRLRSHSSCRLILTTPMRPRSG